MAKAVSTEVPWSIHQDKILK